VKAELTLAAEKDVRDILRQTIELFGEGQLRAYSRIIQSGIDMIAERPDRPSSFDREEIAKGVRSLHLELAGNRRGSAAHVLYYTIGQLSNGTEGVLVLRLLHESAEPRRRVKRALGRGDSR
jgi:toxin ParE1/3/4